MGYVTLPLRVSKWTWGPNWNLGKRLFLVHALPLHLCHDLLLFSLPFSLLILKSVITPLLLLLFSGYFVTTLP